MARKTIRQRIALDGGEQIKKELEQFGATGEKVFRDLKQAADRLDGVGDNFTRNIQKTAAALDAVGAKAKVAGQKIQGVGRSLSLYVTAPLAAVGVASVKAFGDFEEKLSNVGTLIDTGAESLDQMKKQIIEIGNRTPVGLGELTDALYQIRSAGVGAADQFTVLQSSAKLAVAGLGTTSQAVDLITSALNSFGISAAKSGQVADQIFKTVKNGKTTIDGLSQGFGAVASTVQNAGVQLDEFLSAVAALTTTGEPASQAYTQLRAAISGLTRQTKEGAAVLDRLGVKSFKELVQRSGGLVNAFKAIRKAIGDNDSELSKALGSAEAYNAVIALAGNQNKAFTDTLGQMRSGVDDLSTAFDKQNNTVNKRLQVLKNRFDSIRATIGEDLLPVFEKFAGAVDTITSKFENLSPAMRSTIESIAGIAAAIGPATIAAGIFVSSIGAIVSGFGRLIPVIGLAISGFADFVLLVQANPLIAAIVAIGSAIAAHWIANIREASRAASSHRALVQQIKDAYDKAGDATKNWAEQIAKGSITQAQANLLQFKKTLTDVRNEALTPIVQKNPFANFDPVFRQLAEIVRAFHEGQVSAQQFKAEVDALAQANPDFDRNLVLQLLNVADKAKDAETNVKSASAVINVLSGSASNADRALLGLQEKLAPAAEKADRLSQTVKKADDATKDLGKTVSVTSFGGGSGPVKQSYDLAQGVAKAVDQTKQSLDTLDASATSAAQKVEKVSNDVQTVIRTVPQALQGQQISVEGITAPLDQLQSKVQQVFTGLGNLATNGLNSISQAIQQIADQINTQIDAIISKLRSAAAEAARLRSQASGGSGSYGRYAGGGRFSGRGTGTSDSNLAWISDGEFIVNAFATERYLPLLQAINSMRLDFSKLPAFSLGGLMAGIGNSLSGLRPIPAFATGGLNIAPSAPAGRPVHVTIGGETFQMVAPNDVAEKFIRFASQQDMRSAGRSPSWVGR